MKKHVIPFLMLALCAFAACNKNAGPAEPGTPNDDEQNPPAARLVKKISTENNVDGIKKTIDFTYDNSDRIVAMTRSLKAPLWGVSEDWQTTYTYSGNSVESTEIVCYNYDGESGTFTFVTRVQLNSATKYIVSGEASSKEEGVFNRDIGTDVWSAGYDNAYLKSTSAKKESPKVLAGMSGYARKQAESKGQGYYYFYNLFDWTNENLTTIEQIMDTEPRHDFGYKRVKHCVIAEYNTTASNKSNIDLNWFVCEEEDFMLTDENHFNFLVMGLYGKRSKNLMSKIALVFADDDTTIPMDSRTYQYTFDNEGDVTEWVAMSDGQAVATYKVEYVTGN